MYQILNVNQFFSMALLKRQLLLTLGPRQTKTAMLSLAALLPELIHEEPRRIRCFFLQKRLYTY